MAGVKLIIDNEAVRTRFSLQDLQDVNDAIDSGLIAAHVAFQGALGTVFEENLNQTNVFFLDSNLFPINPNNMFRLRLKQAFLKPGSVSIKYADLRKDVLGVGATTLPVTDYHVDEDKGLVFVDADSYKSKYLAVTYSAGFGSTTGVKAPEWLQEGVLAWMPAVFLYSAHGSEPDKVVKTAQEIQRLALSSVDRYKRETALQLTPIY